jgi:sialate O-acetylesterase
MFVTQNPLFIWTSGGQKIMRHNRTYFALVLAPLFWIALGVPLSADVRLPAVIGDHMVLQQQKPVTIWGWAGRGEKVMVALAGDSQEARASAEGKWQVIFDPLMPGGAPLELTVRGENGPAIAVRDILVGEVWLCSGQSNMEWPVASTLSPTPEILRADHPGIRLFLVPKRLADRPLEDVEAKWQVCSPKTVGPFSAVAYYFGLELHQKLGVPVGLVESAWGGSDIEPWTPPAGFVAVPEVQSILAAQEAKNSEYRQELKKSLPLWETWLRETQKALTANTVLPSEPGNGRFPENPSEAFRAPTALYNGMIHAVTPFAIRGAIWYQGENNRPDGLFYEKKMQALIRGWREAWRLGDFPFYYVQLAPYNYPYNNREAAPGDIPDQLLLPLIWESQINALRIPNTGMAVVTDIADLNDIHPRNKKDVGHRLALWARARTYGEKDLVPSGPLYKSMAIEGDTVKISFDYAGSLITNDGLPLRWFEIAGEDRVFYRAAADIAGETVVVHSARAAVPKAVRFGWNQLAIPNLANGEGLPASPFRTDNW